MGSNNNRPGQMSNKAIDQTLNATGGVRAPEVNVVDDQKLEVPTHELNEAMDVEKFMNELVLIEIADTTNENEPPSVVLSVNGLTQPVYRGQPTLVRRMFVEVLARCKESKYNQRTRNPNEPDKIELVSRTALAYPFQVLEDKNPKGRDWLRAVLMEPA